VGDVLKALRTEALNARLKYAPGGNRVVWAARDIVRLRSYIAEMSENAFLETADRPSAEVGKLADTGAAAVMTEQDAAFLFKISSKRVDLVGDSVDPAGIDCSDFAGNPAVLSSHDSLTVPIATSGRPWVSGNSLMAIATFPKAGINTAGDEVAAAIRAGLIRGASIGFVPLEWKFSTDRSRPLGVDFQRVKLLEWSVCAIPCNPDALIVGPARNSKSTPADDSASMAARRREARQFVSEARARIASVSDVAAPTRGERLAQARNFRRIARGGGL